MVTTRDLANLYGVETKRINEAVKNNPEKFPGRYSFILNNTESQNLLVENFDQKIERRGGKYKNPRVFTEQGVAMLATILKSKQATEASIKIMDAFVKMRHFIMDNKEFLIELNLIKRKLLEHDNKIEELFDKFKVEDNRIFFNGEIYDAYSLLLDILKRAKEEIIIIDNYADKKILDLVSKLKVKVTIVSGNMSEELIKKYNKQYNNVRIIRNNLFHDRFIIMDRNKLYVSGASFKDLGEKCFAINIIKDNNYLNNIINLIL